jgi:transposase
MKELTLTEKEQRRLHILNLVTEGRIGVEDASRAMGISERQTWRILKAFKEQGASSLTHGNRCRRPPNAMANELKQTVINLACTKYAGLNYTHFSELLAERENITLSRSTVRNLLREIGIASKRRRRSPRFRYRRARTPQEGMLIQMDGSQHDWLEGRGPSFTLLLAVDDATGTVPYAIFREQEGTTGYFQLIEGIIRRRGVPLALYTDRHAVFKHTRPCFSPRPRDKKDTRHTQFSRAMKQLSITMILARTPQGKGRVERMMETFQDRLVSELRLAGISDMDGANQLLQEYLPRFNIRFGVTPSQVESAYRSLGPNLDLRTILCFHHIRTVLRDNTIRMGWRTLQLLPDSTNSSYAGKRVLIMEFPNNNLEVVSDAGIVINFKEAPRKTHYFDTPNQIVDPNLPEWLRIALQKQHDTLEAQIQAPAMRQPTAHQQSRWDAIQEARSQGLSIRETAKLLHVSRKSVRKYRASVSPPLYSTKQEKI